jgi:hypothetical protein
MRSGATDLQENGARLGGTGRPLVRSVWGKSGAVGETGPFSERTLVLSASEAPIAGREASRVGSETTQTPCPKSALGRAAPVYNLLARRQCDRVGPSACAARHTQCRTSPRSPWFAPDSPLEGDGFELLVPLHESPGFSAHGERSLPDSPLEREGFEPSVPLSRHPSAHCSDTWCCGVGLCFLGTALLLCPGVRAAFRVEHDSPLERGKSIDD